MEFGSGIEGDAPSSLGHNCRHLKDYISLLKTFISSTLLKSGVIELSKTLSLSWRSP